MASPFHNVGVPFSSDGNPVLVNQIEKTAKGMSRKRGECLKIDLPVPLDPPLDHVGTQKSISPTLCRLEKKRQSALL